MRGACVRARPRRGARREVQAAAGGRAGGTRVLESERCQRQGRGGVARAEGWTRGCELEPPRGDRPPRTRRPRGQRGEPGRPGGAGRPRRLRAEVSATGGGAAAVVGGEVGGGRPRSWSWSWAGGGVTGRTSPPSCSRAWRDPEERAPALGALSLLPGVGRGPPQSSGVRLLPRDAGGGGWGGSEGWGGGGGRRHLAGGAPSPPVTPGWGTLFLPRARYRT